MRKFTLIIAFIAMVSFVFGQSANTPTYMKGQAKINRFIPQSKGKITHSAKPTTLIWSDDFSTTTNWTISHASGTTDDWQIVSSSMTTQMHNYMGTFPNASGNVGACDGITALIAAGGTGTVPLMDAWLTTASPINLTGYSAVTIKFWQHYKAFNSDTSYLQFSTDGGTTWPYQISVNPKSAYPVNVYGPDSIELVVSQYIANQSNVKIRFRFLTTNTSPLYGRGYGWAVDYIQLIQPNTNSMMIQGILPSFDYCYAGATTYYPGEGTYQYFPASCPTRIVNAAYIANTGASAQTNTVLTVNINDPYSSNYSESTATGHTINSGTTNDTLTAGYTLSAGTATYGNPFYLNCINGFTPTIGALQHINNQKYVINYVLTSSSITTPTPNMVDSFAFYVGYQGNPYTGGPDLQYTFARNNQNPQCGSVSPQSWSSGNTDGDGIYTSFSIWDGGGTAATPTCVNYMHIFISPRSTFDATTHIGCSITGYIYYYDMTSSSWTSQISTNPYDLTPADTGTFKQLDFIPNGNAEFLNAGLYICGVEITYNSDSVSFGEDYTSLQSWASTYWKFASTTNGIGPMSNYTNTPMINLTMYSNPLAIKHVNDNNIVSIYPNPSKGLVNIVAPENSKIEVFNLLGIKVAYIEHSSALNKVDLSNFSEGNYIVKVTSGNKVTTKKLNLIK
jgi:hypothetical protein